VGRLEKLSARNLSSQTQLDDAREQLEAFKADNKAAVAQLAIVEDSLTKSRVVAPVSGVIQRRLIATGDFVARGQPLFEITRPDQLQAWLPYPEAVALKIRIGQQAEIFSPLTPGEHVTGVVTDLQPTIGNGSRAVMAIVDLDDPGRLRPGATLSGKVLVETRRQAVMVPNSTIIRRPAGELVYVINGNRAEARLVKPGYQEDGMIEIVSGLASGEKIAADGASFLTDGAMVKVAE
jgi:RND family efflux transporter MFP subunit